MLLRFLSAYSQFNSGFIDNVETLLGLLENEDHIEILKENLEEEMGEYDEETMLECEKVGIPREAVEGVPHRELFKQLVEFVETVLQRSYGKFIPGYICEKLNQAIEYAKGQGRLGLLAALYFGSELIGVVKSGINIDADRLVRIINIDQKEVFAPVHITGNSGFAC